MGFLGKLAGVAGGIVGGPAGALVGAGAGLLSGGGSAIADPYKSTNYNPVAVNKTDYAYGDDPGAYAADISRWRGQEEAMSNRQAYEIDQGQMLADYNMQQQARANAEQVRAQQQAFASQLLAQAEGRGGPSAAELQGRAALQDANSAASQMAASARGGNSVLAMRQAMQSQSANQQIASRDAAMLRAREQAEARGQYAGLLAEMRQGDFATRGGDFTARQGSMQQQELLAGNEMSQRQLNQQGQLAYLQAQQHATDTQAGLSQAYAKDKVTAGMGAQELSAQSKAAAKQQGAETQRTILTTAGGLAKTGAGGGGK